MKRKFHGFSFVEVLVALAVAAIIIKLSSSLILDLSRADWQYSHHRTNAEIELFLKIFRNDIMHATKKPKATKNILIERNNDSIIITFKKLVVLPTDGELTFAEITWIFGDNTLSRNVEADSHPLILKSEGMTSSINQLSDLLFYLTISTNKKVYKQVIDGR